MKIVVTGSIAYDYIMKVNDQFSNYILPDQIDKLNVSFVVSEMKKSIGGVATNVAYNLGLLWLKDDTIMLGSVWSDFQIEEKTSQYINFWNIFKVENDLTASAYLITDNKQHQIIPFYPGAMWQAHNQSINKINDEINYLVASPNDKFAIIKFLKESKEKNIKCLFHPWQTTSIISKEEMLECFGYANYLICNEYEFHLVMSITWMSKENIIWSFEKVIITLWENWLDFYENNILIHLDIIKIEKVIDPTWAWDSLIWWLLAGLYKWNQRADSLRLWLLLASYCIQQLWALNHFFTVEEIKTKFKENFWTEIKL